MPEIGRNAPCPCGSGKKHKKCCLEKTRAEEERRRDEGNAVAEALAWLSEHHAEAVEEAIREDYFGELDDDATEALNDLPAGLQGMLEMNLGE